MVNLVGQPPVSIERGNDQVQIAWGSVPLSIAVSGERQWHSDDRLQVSEDLVAWTDVETFFNGAPSLNRLAVSMLSYGLGRCAMCVG